MKRKELGFSYQYVESSLVPESPALLRDTTWVIFGCCVGLLLMRMDSETDCCTSPVSKRGFGEESIWHSKERIGEEC